MTAVSLLLFILVLVLAASTVALAWYVLRMRAEKHGRGLFGPWPVPVVALEDFDARFKAGPLGPSRETEIAFIGAYRVPGGVSDLETWVLGSLAKDAQAIFEFGTATGKTTYLLARNAPDDATVTTLTLGPEQLSQYQGEASDDPAAEKAAAEESRFEAFYYSGTEVEPKITQLFGDSKSFDAAPYAGQCDLVFVDGSHAYSYVKNDTEKALAMTRPGGVILWHDYRGPRRTKGVYQALNERKDELGLVRLKGTSLVAYRKPG